MHAGVVMERISVPESASFDFMVLSKWGDQGGEYLHRFRDVPDTFGDIVEFWTERRPR